jgi:hypothetical protein
MKWSIEISPLIPAPFFYGLAAVALVLVVLLLLRRSRGALLRAASLAALIGAVGNPTLVEEQRQGLPNIALVLLDQSASQSIARRPERVEAIRRDLAEKLGKIPNLEARWITAGGSGEGETRDGTLLFEDLNRALANLPPDRIAGVVMVTDGQVHDVPANAKALGFDAPVHTLLTGARGEFDRRIEILAAPRYGIVGSSRPIELKIVDQGRDGVGPNVNVTIRREGKPDETRRTRVGQSLKTEMSFPHAGQNVVEIEVEAAPGELTTANNRTIIAAEGVRENLRVLLVSGEPHAGERTWRNLLKSDAAVDLVHFTILRPPEKQDGTPIHQLSLIAFPTRELFVEKIKDFDLIIFDRYQRRGILPLIYYDNIARYVDEHGGALLVAAGDDLATPTSLFKTPLASVLPAQPSGTLREQPFKAMLTGDGLKHPVTRALPGWDPKDPKWGRWFRMVDVVPTRGRSIMHGPQNNPLLLLDRKGKGRVAMLLSDHAWLWARGYEGGGPHTDLLRRLSHWLMKEPDLEEEALRATATRDSIQIERRSMLDAVPPVIVTGPDGRMSRVVLKDSGPGMWRDTFGAKIPGLYKLQSGQLSAVAHVGNANSREMNEVVATEAKLKPIADETGAGIFWTARRSGEGADPAAVEMPRVTMLSGARVLAGSGWLGLRDREAYVTRGVSLTPMFTGFLALALLLALLTVAWWREGR